MIYKLHHIRPTTQ